LAVSVALVVGSLPAFEVCVALAVAVVPVPGCPAADWLGVPVNLMMATAPMARPTTAAPTDARITPADDLGGFAPVEVMKGADVMPGCDAAWGDGCVAGVKLGGACWYCCGVKCGCDPDGVVCGKDARPVGAN
jgi:hypothetical protein